ncbi:MAG: hypothetical protein Ct9H300mP11_05500 [Chloroflexota bacterium]|nr:MAG: hypothetical protein Ct9H300mP11_05500 [Chloroflexota bacterium]
MQRSKSEALFTEAQKYIPGGVNTPFRSFRSVGGTPPFIARGQPARVWDVDGNEYIDYLGSWGPLVLGHSHPAVVEAIKKSAESGPSFGAPVEQEVELAKIICDQLPSVESVRLVSSGTEACMSAIGLARAFTNRDKIIKFAGCYHGHADGLLVKAGSGALTHGIPTSAGVPESYASETLVADITTSSPSINSSPQTLRLLLQSSLSRSLVTWELFLLCQDSWKAFVGLLKITAPF